jgi:RNA polymerase sigma factor (sigma-70 family)
VARDKDAENWRQESQAAKKCTIPHNIFSGPSSSPSWNELVLVLMTALIASMTEEDRELTATVLRERARLSSFIRRRVADPGEAEDMVQDVLEELVEAWRLPEPIEQVGSWLFRVARNRIIDRFRRKKRRAGVDIEMNSADDDELRLDLELPDPGSGPEALYARSVLLETLQQALDELPENQHDVFIAHELEGKSFKEMAAESGTAINTLLARKRYAVMHLRSALEAVYDDLGM